MRISTAFQRGTLGLALMTAVLVAAVQWNFIEIPLLRSYSYNSVSPLAAKSANTTAKKVIEQKDNKLASSLTVGVNAKIASRPIARYVQGRHYNHSHRNAPARPTLKPLHGLKPPVESTEDRQKCQQLLDDVNITHVTNEGKTFTDDELDIQGYKNKTPIIPRILHQTWDDYNIPKIAVPWIKSLLMRHQGWEYWFWTQHDVKCYLRHKHPKYLELYNHYAAIIYRTDVMRYFLLYDYGGIYLDLDVEALKPLDVWLHLAPAILSHETYEHSFVMHRLKEPNVMTTILASKPGHPYFKLLQENLQQYHKAKPNDVLHSTGPYFLDDIYKRFKPANKSEDILAIHPRYWLPTYDNVMSMSTICSCSLLRDGFYVKPRSSEKILKTHDVLQLCAIAKKNNFTNTPAKQSYLDHHWVHTNLQKADFKHKNNLVSIFEILPNLVPVHKRLGLQC